MSCQGESNCTCGCCGGISVMTPQGETNPPGLSAIAYRTGTWATFKDSMLARLSSSDYPALSGLKTRDDDDYSIALLDASAVVLDILTFYQERLANENYLRTATQMYSLTQLSQLIGYQPLPGVSASTYLAFTLSAAPGLPDNPNTTAITIPTGTTVQSVPAQGQMPQYFQTSAAILAKPDWNALPVQTGVPWRPKGLPGGTRPGTTSVYLAGTSTQLNPGDAFVIVGDEFLGDATSSPNVTNQQWDLRIVSSVVPDTVNQRTLVMWSQPLGNGYTRPARKNPRFFALRQKAALFGYNAMNPNMLPSDAITNYGSQISNLNPAGTTPTYEWAYTDNGDFSIPLLIDLDAVYTKVVSGGLVALVYDDDNYFGTPFGKSQLYLARAVTPTTRSDYGMSAKITRVQAADSGDPGSFLQSHLGNAYSNTRTASAFAQSEELIVAEQPLDHPLYGTLLDLEQVRQDLVGVTAVAITGKSQKMTVNAGVNGLLFTPDDGTAQIPLKPGDTVTLLQPPSKVLRKNGTIPNWQTYPDKLQLTIADSSGRSGTVEAMLSQFSLTVAASSDPVVQEFALVVKVLLELWPVARTRLVLQNPLTFCYDRTVTTVNANVGAATGGSPVTELLGNGSAATPNQSFTLKQSPLTYTQAATPSGSASSLQVRANGAAWTEVPTLYAQKPNGQVFDVMNLTGGTAVVQFGDGVEGATLPTGQSNVIANYRVGLGAAGNVAAGTITTLVDRPVGVKGVTNPTAATGGQDSQSIDDIRTNAPQSVLTLGRAVSITDYQNFASTFAGIAKASAIWIPNGVNRGVFLTVAGAGGSALPPGCSTLANLVTALQTFGNPNVAIHAHSYYETLFRLSASIAFDPAYDPSVVKTAVRALLTSTYSFASRNFGQGVSGDEIAALIQGVTGVVAANVTSVQVVASSAAGDLGSAAFSVSAWNNWIAQKKHLKRPHGGPTRICPYVPVARIGKLPKPAEILVLDPDPTQVVLEGMA